MDKSNETILSEKPIDENTNIIRTQMFWGAADDSYHTPETISAVTELSMNTLVNWRAQGRGPVFVKSGKLIYYRKKDVVEWFKTFQPSNLQAA